MPTRSIANLTPALYRRAVPLALSLLLSACGGGDAPTTERDEDAVQRDGAARPNGAAGDDDDGNGESERANASGARDSGRAVSREAGAIPSGARDRDAAAPLRDAGGPAPEPDEPLATDAAASQDGAPVDPSSSDAGGSLGLPSVASTAMDGPFMAMQDLSGGPRGNSGVFRPSELGKEGLKHPVFIWGCGGSSTPSSYAEQLRRIATHGFIVVAEVSRIGDNGAPLKAAIDWILAENGRSESPFRGHVAVDRVALGGHSIGSANAFFIANDPRLSTTVHIAGGSLDNVNDPFAPTTGMGGKRIVKPVAYICSMSDTFMNVEKSSKDYDNTRAPAWMTVMTGVEHVGAARSGLPATIAWLRWHLAGESERRAAFLSQGGEFTTGIFVSRSKNW